MLCGGFALLEYNGMTGRLLEKLIMALLVKFPSLNSNFPLFIVFSNI
jgi:hypothetical protein